MKKLSLILALLSVVLLGFSQSSGDMRYSGGDIQYYNGSTWVTISSTSSVNPETFGAATVKGSAEGKYVYTATGGTESKILVDSIGSWFGHQVISISNDTIYLTDGGFAVLPSTPAELWETHENGIATIDSEEVYLLNILNGCAIDTSIISDGAGYEGMDLILGAGYASDNDLSTNGVLTNNTPTALSALDGTRFRVQSDSSGVFSLPISIADSACYQGKVLTGVRFEINGVTTSTLKSDSSNTVRVIPTLEENDSIAYIDTLVENISIIINGVDTNVVTTIDFRAVDANDGFSPLNYANQYDFRLTFPCSDTIDFYIDQIKAVPLYDGDLANINIGINPITGKISINNTYEEVLSKNGNVVTFADNDNDTIFLVGESSGVQSFILTSKGTTNSVFRINAENTDKDMPASVQTVAFSNTDPVNEMTVKYIELGDTMEIDVKLTDEALFIGNSEIGTEHYTMPLIRGESGQILRLKSDFEGGGDYNMLWAFGDSTQEEFYLYSILSETTKFEGNSFEASGDSILRLNTDGDLQISLPTTVDSGQVLITVDDAGTMEFSGVAIEFTPSSSTDATYSKGTITYDSSYIYIKTDDSVSGTDTWLRVSIATW